MLEIVCHQVFLFEMNHFVKIESKRGEITLFSSPCK